jgi:hypothetical protein
LVFLVILPQVLNYLQGTGNAGSKLYKAVAQDDEKTAGEEEGDEELLPGTRVYGGGPHHLPTIMSQRKKRE